VSKVSNKLPKENYIGCLVGGAIGDALGAPVEFISFQEIKERYGENGITDYVEFKDGHGEITDDTQMTLFTAEAVLRSICRAQTRGIWGAISTIAYGAYKRWLITQNEIPIIGKTDSWLMDIPELYKRRAPGMTCLSALQENDSSLDTEAANISKGCGGVMRVAPAGLVFHDMKFAFENGCILAKITHGHPSGYLAAGFFAAVISGINSGLCLKESVEKSLELLKKEKDSEESVHFIKRAVLLSMMNKPSARTIATLGSGWVAEEAIAIAIYCSLYYENDFEAGVLAAVNHDGDSDSTGSITGNILGLINGIDSIPKEWVNNLHLCDIITKMAIDLHTEYVYDGITKTTDEWSDRYPPS